MWRPATFKGKDIWIEVGPDGEPKTSMGRVPMRYSKRGGAKIYRANLKNVSIASDGMPVDLPDGESADAKKKSSKRGSGFGSAKTRTAAQAAAAKRDAAARLDALDADTTVAFTDGGCRGNPGPAGSGVFIEFSDGRRVAAARSLGRGTNNIAELTAIDMALDLLDEAGLPADAKVVLFSDSSYANGVLTKGWKAKKNVALIQGLRDKLAARSGVDLQWVAGHAGIEGNERADALATAGVDGSTSTEWS